MPDGRPLLPPCGQRGEMSDVSHVSSLKHRICPELHFSFLSRIVFDLMFHLFRAKLHLIVKQIDQIIKSNLWFIVVQLLYSDKNETVPFLLCKCLRNLDLGNRNSCAI